MGKRALVNVGLAVVALVLMLIVYLEPGDDRSGQPVRLTDLAAVDVSRMLIRRKDGDEIEFERREGGWFLAAPLQVAANEVRVERLLQLTETASHGQFETVRGELARYGLDPPAAELYLNDTAFSFGDTEPIDHRRYVEVDGTIHLIEDRHLQLLQADAADYASNRLLPEGVRITGLELPDFSLARNDRGGWTLSPRNENVSADSLNGLVDAWVDARAIAIDRYADDQSRGIVTVYLEDRPQKIEYHIVASEPELLLARPVLGLVYHLGSEQGRRLMDLAPQSQQPSQ